jgi:ubiquinone/menaquinone biosynthesis C-methylase UbiE
MKSTINLKSEVYYQGTYWNNYPLVVEYMCQNFTGDKKKWWVEDFKVRYAPKPFEHALFLNCGDGRWERDFIDKKIVKKATAFDISPDLIKIAKKAKGKRRIKYLVADANKVRFPKNEFDLVVNYAALHHTQYINRICKLLAEAIKPEGFLVNFEYIGPHRNQFPLWEWFLAHQMNDKLPKFCQQDLRYPHIPTMLVMDPTEAIHSELIVKSMKSYFNVLEKHDTGGGIAYLLLTHNQKMSQLPPKKANRYIHKILREDAKYTRLHLVPQLFSYFIAQPNKEILRDKERSKKYQDEENAREKLATQRRGVYSFIDYLKLIKNSRNLRERLSLLRRYPYLVDAIFLIKKVALGF